MSARGPLLRGRVYAAKIIGDEKYYLVVSNNGRNAALGSGLAVRLTTTPKQSVPSIVPLPSGEVVVGSVLCDDMTVIHEDEVARDLGALSRPAMDRIDRGLKFALALS